MAIYNNREVGVLGPNPQAATPETISIRYLDGTHENVKLSSVRFTEDEKKALQKQYPSKYDDVETVKDEDLKAVRVGVPPSYDRSVQASAETQVQREQQQKLSSEQMNRAKEDANKKFDRKVNAPAMAPAVSPVGSTQTQVKK